MFPPGSVETEYVVTVTVKGVIFFFLILMVDFYIEYKQTKVH